MTDKQPSLARSALSGVFWVSIGTVLIKTSSLLAQFALGWLLTKNDFALYAIALSTASVVMSLRNGGTQQVLIQRGAQFRELSSIIACIALAFNIFGFLILVLLSHALAQFYADNRLKILTAIIALSLPLGTYGLIFQAKLSIDLAFRKLTAITTTSAVIRNLSAVAFATLGLGSLSFVLPLIVGALFELVAGLRVVKEPIRLRAVTREELSFVIRDSRWIVFGAIATSISMNGDYFIISILESKETLALYFFGFQLSAAMSNLFTGGLSSVMMPTFSRISDNPSRQRAAFLRAVRIFSWGSSLACFAMVSAAAPLISWLWQGKWDESIIVVQLLSASLSLRLIASLARSLLEAQRRWKLVFLLLLFDSIGTIAAAALGAWLGSLLQIAVAISIYRGFVGVLYCVIAAHFAGARPIDILLPVLGTFFAATVSAVLVLQLIQAVPSSRALLPTAEDLAMSLGSFFAIFLLISGVFNRRVMAEILSLIPYRRSTSKE